MEIEWEYYYFLIVTFFCNFKHRRQVTVLLVGLDNAGKTCTIKSIMKGKTTLDGSIRYNGYVIK